MKLTYSEGQATNGTKYFQVVASDGNGIPEIHVFSTMAEVLAFQKGMKVAQTLANRAIQSLPTQFTN